MFKQILKATLFVKGIALTLGLIYVFALPSLGSPGLAVLFTYLMAAALALPIMAIFDKVMMREPVKLRDLRKTGKSGFLSIFSKKEEPLPLVGEIIQAKTKKGRYLRTVKVIGVDKSRRSPRVRVQHIGLPGNRSFTCKPHDLVLAAA